MRHKPIALSALMGALLAGAFLSACVPQQPAAKAGEAKTYPVTGELVAFRSENRVAILKHDKIEGLMEAMTMGFELADPRLAEGLKAGDKVSAVLSVSDDAYVLTELKKR